MSRKSLHYFFTILISLIGFFNYVVAPPPLDVELKAEKLQENSQDLQKSDIGNVELIDEENQVINEQIKKKFDLLKLNLNDELPESVNIIDDPKEMKVLLANKNVNNGEVVEEFTRLELPADFNEYDVNNDGYIDLDELIDATGARENAKSAFDDSDIDGDGQISKKEFSYWFPDGKTLDISDELNNYDHAENDDETLNADNDVNNGDVDDNETASEESKEESDRGVGEQNDDLNDNDDNERNIEVDDIDDSIDDDGDDDDNDEHIEVIDIEGNEDLDDDNDDLDDDDKIDKRK